MPGSCAYARGNSPKNICIIFLGYLKGKSESRIAEYIQNQLKEDEMGEQMTMGEYSPFTGSK